MNERTLNAKRIFDGRVVALEVHDVELHDGRRSVREIVRHAPAVGVVARLQDGTFLFVRQFRKAMEEAVIEVCAGLVDPGETPEAAARRELREETGCEARTLRRLGRLYSSPGFTDEWAEIYAAECPPPVAAPRLDGDEHLETVRLSRGEVEARIADGRIRDGKTVAAWLLYDRLVGFDEPA
jgi:ADP-ribose pyrophosphatase